MPHIIAPPFIIPSIIVFAPVEIDLAISLGERHPAGIHVDLDRGQEQPRHCQCGVTLGAHLHEFIFTDPFVYVDVVSGLLGNLCAPASSDLGSSIGGYGDGACLFALPPM